MFRNHNKEKIWRFSTVINSPFEKKSYHGYPTITHKVPYSFLPGISSVKYWFFQKKGLKTCVNKIVDIVVENDIKLIWSVCNDSFIINISSELLKRINIPFVTQIWDTPEYLAKGMRLDPFSYNHLLANFKMIMKNTDRGVVISDSMGKIYSDRYELKSDTMVFSPPLDSFPKTKVLLKNIKEEITVVFAGGLYAYKTWNAFLDAVEMRNNSTGHPRIKVRCIGRLSRWDKKRVWVSYEALKPVEEASIAVNEADIAYLPYWMSKKHAFTVKTAFPSKLSFYTSCGTPVLFHGPKESTPSYFLNKHHVGIACNSLEADDILETIDLLFSDVFLSQYEASQQKALNTVFHPDRIIEIFENTIFKALNTNL